MRSCTLILLVAAITLPIDRADADEHVTRQLFQSHCVGCHGADVQEAGLRLDSQSADFTIPEVFATCVGPRAP